MPVIDDIRKQQKSMKTKSRKERWDYFWYYYKTHTIIAIIVLVVGTILIYDLVTSKGTAFYVAFLNSFAQSPEEDEQFIDEFAPLTDIDFTKDIIYLDTNMCFNMDTYDELSMAAAEKFLALAASGEIDVLVSERDVFANYANNGTFMDLKNCLTQSQYEKYKDHFFYYDRSLLDAEPDYERITGNGPAIPHDTADRRNPESMKDPVPVGIFLDGPMKKRITDRGYYVDKQEVILGFMNLSDTQEYCQMFLDWLSDSEYTQD